MKSAMVRIAAIASLVLTGLSVADRPACSAGVETPVQTGTSTVRCGMSDGSVFRVILSVEKAAGVLCAPPTYWGSQSPRLLIKRLVATVNGDTLQIPAGAYLDLSQPIRMRLDPDESGAKLTIFGGDAGPETEYNAALEFSGGTLRRRRVEAGEDTVTRWEETTYSPKPSLSRGQRSSGSRR